MEIAHTHQFKTVYNKCLVENQNQTYIDCYIMVMGCQFTSDFHMDFYSHVGNLSLDLMSPSLTIYPLNHNGLCF